MVDEMEGRGHSSNDDTEDAEDEMVDDEINEGTANDDWNKGVAGGTIISMSRPRWGTSKPRDKRSSVLGALGNTDVKDSVLTEDLRGDR